MWVPLCLQPPRPEPNAPRSRQRGSQLNQAGRRLPDCLPPFLLLHDAPGMIQVKWQKHVEGRTWLLADGPRAAADMAGGLGSASSPLSSSSTTREGCWGKSWRLARAGTVAMEYSWHITNTPVR